MGRDRKKGRREGGGGDGKIVNLSTSTSAQIPNHKPSEKNRHKQTTQLL